MPSAMDARTRNQVTFPKYGGGTSVGMTFPLRRGGPEMEETLDPSMSEM